MSGRRRPDRGGLALLTLALCLPAAPVEAHVPAGCPGGGGMGPESLRKSIREAAEGRAPLGWTAVSLQVGGGAPGERYQLFLQVEADGSAHWRFRDDLRGLSEREGQGRVPPGMVAALFRRIQAIDPTCLARMGVGRVVPGTTVGTFEISGSDTRIRVPFVIVADRPEAPKRVAPPDLMEVLDAMYALGADLVGVESVGP